MTATALDEILVWAGILVERVLSATRTIELRYRRPVDVGESIVVSGRVAHRSVRRPRP